MKTAMKLEQALEVSKTALESSFSVNIVPCIYSPEEFNVFADGIQIIPTEEVREIKCADYVMRWGKNDQGTYWVTFIYGKDSVTISGKTPPSSESVVCAEEIFCEDVGIPNERLADVIDWTPWPGMDCFDKIAGTAAVDETLRGCPLGCGRVLRSHERSCPECVYEGALLYES